MRTIQFENKTHQFPDDVNDAEVADALERSSERTLLSIEGLGSTLKLVGPSIARGILGSQLAGEEEVYNAQKLKDPTLPEPETITIKRKAIQEADIELERISGRPSKPLEIAQSVVGSVAQNATGMAAAVASRNIGPAAAIVPLQQAQEMTKGQEYATARVGKGAEIEPSLMHAETAGAAEAAFELLPTAWLIKNLGKMGAVEFVAKYIGRELATELPTTAVQKISERMYIEPDKPLGEFIKETGKALVDTALVVPFAAGMTGGLAHLQTRAGSLGQPEAIETPVKTPIAESVASIGMEGITPSIPPQFDQPSLPLQSDELIGLDALLANIDPDTLTDEDVAKAQAIVAKHEELRKSPPNLQAEAEWAVLADAPKNPIDDIGELGASSKQTANAVNYSNPNNSIDRMDNVFLLGPEGSVGLTPLQVVPQSGTYTLGQATTDRPLEYITPLHQTMEKWRLENMPDSTIVLLNEQQFSNSALGWHYSLPGNRRMHVIVPAVLRSPSKGLGAFNANTQASAFYNLSHEFGHGIVKEKFLEGVAIETAAAVVRESEKGLVTEATIASLPEIQQAVIREYNAIKEAIGTNQMSAEQFVQTWLSPAKGQGRNFLGDLKLQPADNAMDVVKAIISRAAKRININDASKEIGRASCR